MPHLNELTFSLRRVVIYLFFNSLHHFLLEHRTKPCSLAPLAYEYTRQDAPGYQPSPVLRAAGLWDPIIQPFPATECLILPTLAMQAQASVPNSMME